LENVIRYNFGFEGTAIKLVFRGRADKRRPQSAEMRR
jgi:predicted GTPase